MAQLTRDDQRGATSATGRDRPAATAGPADEDGGAAPLPGWYAALLRAGLSALLGLALWGLPAAMLGWYRPLVVVPGALAVAAAVWALWPAPAARPAGRSAHAAAGAVVALALVLTVVGARWSGQYLTATRDPGVYALTGVWLAEEGDLDVPGLEAPWAGEPGLVAGGQGFQPAPDGDLYAQGYHLLPALLAVGSWVGGTALLLKVNAVVGGAVLLAVYAFASRLMRPWPAAAATAALGLNLAQWTFVRDPYSEPLSQLFVFAALWALWEGRPARSPRLAVVAGLLLGATAMVRVDAGFVLIGAVAALSADVALTPRRGGEPWPEVARWAGLVVLGAAVPFAVGLADGLLFSRAYVDALWDEVRLLLLALVAVAAAGLVAVAVRDLAAPAGRLLLRRRRPLAVVAAVAVAAAGAWGWFVRPEVDVVRQASPTPSSRLYEGLQAREGLPIDPLRTYAEAALPRLALYLGPVALAAALAGAALAVARQVAAGGRRWLPFLAVFATSAAYLWSPRIVADQPWAMRRFVVVTIPGLLVLAMWLADRLADRWRPAGAVAAAGLAAVTVGFAAWATAPVADVRHQVPMLAAVERTCDVLPDDAAVLLLDDGPSADNAPQTIRFLCDVPVAWTAPTVGIERVAALAAAAEADGFEPVVLANTPEPFGPGTGAEVPATLAVDMPYEVMMLTIEDRPSEAEPQGYRLYRLDVEAATGNT